MKPTRIQLKRTKGWRLPEGAVVVSRPSAWGNPFVATPNAAGGWLLAVAGPRDGDATVQDLCRSLNAYAPLWKSRKAAVEMAVEGFRQLHDNAISRQSARKMLGGRSLACWCPLGSPCHVDVLLDIANH